MVRRPGSWLQGTALNGQTCRLFATDFTDSASYTTELTPGSLRVWTQGGLVFTNDVQDVQNVFPTTPITVEVGGSPSWNTGDQAVFVFTSLGRPSDGSVLANRVFALTKIDSNHYTLADPVSGAAINGTQLQWSAGSDHAQFGRTLILSTPFEADDLPNVKAITAAAVGPGGEDVILFTDGENAPQSLGCTPNATAPQLASFNFFAGGFLDGPYLSVPKNSFLHYVSNSGGQYTFNIAYSAYSATQGYSLGDVVEAGGIVYTSIQVPNYGNTPASSPAFWQVTQAGIAAGPNGLQAGDVGRHVRLLSAPPAWSSLTTYSAGQAVTYNGAYYVAQTSTTGNHPDVSIAQWLVSDSQSIFTWTWGMISSVTNANTFVLNILGPAVLYNADVMTWNIGAWSDAVGWPNCAQYYEGRFWFAGPQPNSVYASNSDDVYNMAPTAADGTVGDGNAISIRMNGTGENTTYWLEITSQGLIAGTKDGEFLIFTSTTQDGITPSTVDAKKVTRVKCSNIVPAHTPLTMALVQNFKRDIYEYFPDTFSGKLVTPKLNIFSRHLTVGGVNEISYQSEATPIVWAWAGVNALQQGQLIGWTYRRTTAFANEEPNFVGGHKHTLGHGRYLDAMVVNKSPDQTYDAVWMSTVNTTGNPYAVGTNYVEFLTPIPDPNDPLVAGWYLDGALVPSGLEDTTGTGVTLYGLSVFNGEKVTAQILGLDCGDYTVNNGTITVPYGSDPGKFLTAAYIQAAYANEREFFRNNGVTYAQTTVFEPGTITNPLWLTALTAHPTVIGNTGQWGIVDWVNGYFYASDEQGAGTNGLISYKLATLNEAQDVSWTTLSGGVGGGPPALASEALAMTHAGWLVWSPGTNGPITQSYLAAANSQSSNAGNLAPINQTGLVTIGGIRDICAGFAGKGAPSPFGVQYGSGQQGHMAIAVTATGAFLSTISAIQVSASDNPASFEMAVNAGSVNLLEGSANIVCTQRQDDNLHETMAAVAVGSHAVVGSLTNTHIYRAFTQAVLSGPPIFSFSQTGTLNASSIAPDWTQFAFGSGANNTAGITGPCWDAADGNLILGVQHDNSHAVNQKFFIIKVDYLGNIKWKVPVNSIPSARSLKNSRVNGQIVVMDTSVSYGGTAVITTINTLTGAYTTLTVPGLKVSEQYYDSTTGAIIVQVTSYNSGTTGAPVAGPNTTSTYTGWAILTVGQAGPISTPGAFLYGGSTQVNSVQTAAIVGYTYTSQGQLLRPVDPRDAGSGNGPGFAKTKRSHMFGALIAGAINAAVSFGTAFASLIPATFRQPNETPYDSETLFSGTHWDTFNDTYSLDSQPCWQVTRPQPFNLTAMGAFLHTQDR